MENGGERAKARGEGDKERKRVAMFKVRRVFSRQILFLETLRGGEGGLLPLNRDHSSPAECLKSAKYRWNSGKFSYATKLCDYSR